MTPIEKILNTAKQEIGYLEKKTNSQLDSKTENAGLNNWTKYARDLDNLGVYDGKKNGYAWCFEAGTYILTPNGLAPIENLSVGDIVIDADGVNRKILKTNSRIAEDTIGIRINGSTKILTTEEHPFLTKQRRSDGTFGDAEWIPSGKLNRLDKVALFIGDFGTNNVPIDVAYMVGRYVGDGWVTNHHGHDRYFICCSYNEADELEKRMMAAKISYKKDLQNRTCQQYEIHRTNRKIEAENNELFTSIISKCGRNATKKRVPDDVWTWNEHCIKSFIEGYYASDGNKSEKRDYYLDFNTSSKELALGISALCRKFNINVNVNINKKEKEECIDDRHVYSHDCYHAYSTCKPTDFYTIEDGYIWGSVKVIDNNRNPAIVYNITVEESHTFIADGYVVHNCDMFVDWCFIKTFGLDLGMQMTYQPMGEWGAGCTASAMYYKRNNSFYKTPQIGDQIFFTKDKGKNMYHTGLVVGFDSNRVYTIEGNTSSDKGVVENGGSVNSKSYPINYNKIGGYGRPNYSLITEEDEDMDVSRFEELWHEYRKSLQDNDSSAYSKEARDWAVNSGLIAGNNSSEFNGMWQDMLTREQLVTVLYRFAKLMGKA